MTEAVAGFHERESADANGKAAFLETHLDRIDPRVVQKADCDRP
jgi:hypothetical protein